VRFVRQRPFLTLALVTLAVGAVWHLSGLNENQGPLGAAMFALAYVLGLPFILAMRLVGSVVTQPALRGVLGFVLGILPYLAADEVVRRRRLRKSPIHSTE
jgi:hypothetical protein